MTNLIDRFKEDLQLAGYAARTIGSYAAAVHRLQRYYNKAVHEITEEDLRQYWLACQSDFGWSAATLRISYSGLKQFFCRTLVRDWKLLNEVRFKRDKTLPTVLSHSEVRHIIDHISTQQGRTFYTVLYSLGLRLSECLNLQVKDIQSDRRQVHIHGGKGARDRILPLPQVTLDVLRAYYQTHRNPTWLFPALGHNNGKDAGTATTHVSDSCVRSVLWRTLKRLPAITKHVHAHVFRHSYATHLIEANVPIRHVQKLLGHTCLQSTMIYLHVTTRAEADSNKLVIDLMQGILS